jgi:predicted membrane chloride channel (bestrophin family)
MDQYVTVFNRRTVVAMLIAITTLYFAYRFNINYNIDLTLISIAIVFPLVFTIRSSFRRREKALEHLSQFRAAIKTLDYFFMSAPTITEEKKVELSTILLEISDQTLNHLNENEYSTNNLDASVNKVYIFIIENKEIIPRPLRDKVIRFMNELHEAIENLHAIHIHRTPVSLKAYCLIFIYIFPVIYTPTIINRIGLDTTIWITYFVVILSEFILISLYNIQDDMEYPFDDKGLDDINLRNFKINR